MKPEGGHLSTACGQVKKHPASVQIKEVPETRHFWVVVWVVCIDWRIRMIQTQDDIHGVLIELEGGLS